jgi:conserved hypothetical protein
LDIINEIVGRKSSEFENKIKENISKARNSFWEYCKLTNPDFYFEDRTFLKDYCNILQNLYERKLYFEDGSLCLKLMINFPPRHGKSRTLVLFVQWCFGKNDNEKAITCSYNDDVASDFSRFTRDGVDQKSQMEEDIHELSVKYGNIQDIPVEEAENVKYVFADIFPKVRIQKGNASFEKWALEGKFFSYKGAGVGGAITGRGGSITIVDDPVKDGATAYNEDALKKIYEWYTNTFKSRAETGAIQIINMTRWSSKDICGELLKDEDEAKEWMHVEYEACDKDGNMLCESILSKKEYLSLKRVMNEDIFLANYHQQPVDITGGLYGEFKTYDFYSEDMVERKIAYVDTADEGADFLLFISGDVIGKYVYITDIYYTDEDMETTEREVARRLTALGIRECLIESNNGGRGFARNVERILKTEFHNKKCTITWFHQSKNKKSRILVNASNVMEQVIMPENWKKKYEDYYQAMRTYQRKGKNLHDDAPDGTTGLVEFINGDVKGKKKMKLLSKKLLGL